MLSPLLILLLLLALLLMAFFHITHLLLEHLLKLAGLVSDDANTLLVSLALVFCLFLVLLGVVHVLLLSLILRPISLSSSTSNTISET